MALGISGRCDESVGKIVNIDVVPQLLPIAENFDSIALHRLPDEPVDHRILVVLHLRSLPVGVGDPKKHARDAVNVVIEQVTVFRSGFIEGIRGPRPQWVFLVNGYVFTAAELQARSGVYDDRVPVESAETFEHVQVAYIINVSIQKWIVHAVVVADLTGKIENDVLVPHQDFYRFFVPYIADVELDTVPDILNIEQIRPVGLNTGIHDGHVCPAIHQFAGDGASNHSQPAGNQYFTRGVRLLIVQSHDPSPHRSRV